MHGAQHLVPVGAASTTMFGGFRIANYPIMMMSGSWRRMGAQPLAKAIRPISFFAWHLVDAGNLKFDGIFDRDDIKNRVVQFVPLEIKCLMVLPEPVGPVTRINPCGASTAAFTCPKVSGSSNSLSRLAERFAIENTQHDLLAMYGRQDWIRANRSHCRPRAAAPSVLRRKRRSTIMRLLMILKRDASAICICFGGGGISQHTVRAVAQLHAFLERLPVDIAQPGL